MNGEELNKKYHEMLGWRPVNGPKVENPGFADDRQWWRVPGGGEIRDRLPNLHLDANLAIAEADRVFREGWCAEFFRDATVEVTATNKAVFTKGGNACEAILLALIAAKAPNA